MKLLQSMMLVILMGVALVVQAVPQEVQVDLLMARISAALKAERAADALPAFAELEGMESSLSKPLPESFNFYYIDTLDKHGDKVKAYDRAEAYLNRYGKKGKHYGEVVEIVTRLQSEVEMLRRKASAGAQALASLPAQMVSIPGRNFELGKYEVTQALWVAVMGGDPPELYFKTCGENCTVEKVSWNDIQEFLQKLNAKTGRQYRLPTEAEWEYACYGGSQTEYCGGNDLNAVGWYDGNSGNTTHPVGQKQANGYGLYDMSGNVWEWMQDCYDGDCSKRVLRGGSWDNSSYSARAAFRYRGGATNRDSGFGFRLARMLP